MTITQIREAVEPHRPMSVRTVYSHLTALEIKPVGNVRQRPQHYPDSTPLRILKRLGVSPKKGGAK